jgi:DNA-binding MarR family transcriptional regulator
MTSRRDEIRQHIQDLMGQMFLNMRPPIELWPLMELTMPQLRTLVVLHTRGPLRVSDVAAQLGVGMPTVTSLVSKLEEKGLAVRGDDPRDRRVVLCSATDQGRLEAERLWRVGRGRMAQITASFGEDDLRLIAWAMDLLVQAAEKSGRSGGAPMSQVGPVRVKSGGESD